MKKICQITTVLPPSKDGVGAAAKKIHTILSKNGYESIILTSSDQIKQDGVYTKIFKWTIFEVYKNIKKIVSSGFSEIIFHYPSPKIKNRHSIIILSFLLFIKKISLIIYLHEYAVYSLKGKLKIFFMIMFAKKIITTDEINLTLLKKIPLIKNKIFKLPTGSNFTIDTTDFDLELVNKFNVAFWGYIMKGKGIQSYISIANSFEEQNINFYFIGDVPEEPTEDDLTLKNKILSSRRIKFLGFLQEQELIETLCNMHIIILPFEDGLSERRGSFMLAMQLGRVVFTTPPKIEIKGLKNNINVLFFENETQLKSNLKDILKNPQLLRQISLNAKNWYQVNYSDKIFLKKLIQILFNSN